ncbi:hypothetical protein A2U01_0019577, partial [Trifolium medium]|nr:hypothetical protein [Trifolium medium]
MKNENDFVFDIQAKSTDLLRKMRTVKLENEKILRGNPTNQGNTIVGNIQRLDRQKGSLNNIVASQQMKKGEANKGVKNNKIKRQLEVQASKEIAVPSKVFVQNNNTKKKLMSTVDHLVKGSIESQVSKNIVSSAMPITEYLNKNKEQDGVDDEDIEESEMEEDMDTDMNYEGEEIEGIDVNTAE